MWLKSCSMQGLVGFISARTVVLAVLYGHGVACWECWTRWELFICKGIWLMKEIDFWWCPPLWPKLLSRDTLTLSMWSDWFARAIAMASAMACSWLWVMYLPRPWLSRSLWVPGVVGLVRITDAASFIPAHWNSAAILVARLSLMSMLLCLPFATPIGLISGLNTDANYC